MLFFAVGAWHGRGEVITRIARYNGNKFYSTSAQASALLHHPRVTCRDIIILSCETLNEERSGPFLRPRQRGASTFMQNKLGNLASPRFQPSHLISHRRIPTPRFESIQP